MRKLDGARGKLSVPTDDRTSYAEDYLRAPTRAVWCSRRDEVLPGYRTRLFRDGRMHWSLREFFAFADGSGGALGWDAELTPAAGGKTTEISGMDLVLLRGVRLSRNEA